MYAIMNMYVDILFACFGVYFWPSLSPPSQGLFTEQLTSSEKKNKKILVQNDSVSRHQKKNDLFSTDQKM